MLLQEHGLPRLRTNAAALFAFENALIAKIIRPEYFYVILGGDYGKFT